MTDPLLRLETQGSDIVITPLPGTNYQVTFRKLADYPGISASHNIQEEPDPSYHSVRVSCPRLANRRTINGAGDARSSPQAVRAKNGSEPIWSYRTLAKVRFRVKSGHQSSAMELVCYVPQADNARF